MAGVVIPTEAAFYVRSALHRALSGLEQSTTVAREYLDDNKESQNVFYDSVRGMLRFETQLMLEMREAFRLLPDEIRPRELVTHEPRDENRTAGPK